MERRKIVMLGISSKTRKSGRDFHAEVRIAEHGAISSETVIPQLCVFEACSSSPMIRILPNQPLNGSIVFEVSTISLGCWTGIEKAFLLHEEGTLKRVYHAEYTTQKLFHQQSFKIQSDFGAQVCKYSHEDEQFNPVWDCKQIKGQKKKKAVAVKNNKERA